MSKRARFETTDGLITISRGTLTIRDGETGVVDAFPVRHVEFNTDTMSLFADVLSASKQWTDLHFQVTRGPTEIREEMLATFVTEEHGRLQNVVKETMGKEDRKPWEEATAVLKAFETKYARFMSKPEPSPKKEKADKPAKKKAKKTQKQSKN